VTASVTRVGVRDVGMSSEHSTPDATALRERLRERLRDDLAPSTYRQATVESVDPETGAVVLSFGCGCSGGLSPPERASLRTGLVEGVPDVRSVSFGSGCGCGGPGRGRGHGHGHGQGRDTGVDTDTSDSPEAPF